MNTSLPSSQDQDNFYRVSTVISKLCEEGKIDVIGCKTKANLQPLPRRRAMERTVLAWRVRSS